jgi:hypothetical protein
LVNLGVGEFRVVGPIKIIPGPTDAKLLESDPTEEERIRAGRCDENKEPQDKQIMRMQEKIEGNSDSVLEELHLERQEVCLLELALCGVVGVGMLLCAVPAIMV